MSKISTNTWIWSSLEKTFPIKTFWKKGEYDSWGRSDQPSSKINFPMLILVYAALRFYEGEQGFPYWRAQAFFLTSFYGHVTTAGHINVHLMFYRVLRNLMNNTTDNPTTCITLTFFIRAQILWSVVEIYPCQCTAFCGKNCRIEHIFHHLLW